MHNLLCIHWWLKNTAVVHVYSDQFDIRNDTVLHILSKQLKLDSKINNHALIKNPWKAMDTVKIYIALNNYIGAVAFYIQTFHLKIFFK